MREEREGSAATTEKRKIKEREMRGVATAMEEEVKISTGDVKGSSAGTCFRRARPWPEEEGALEEWPEPEHELQATVCTGRRRAGLASVFWRATEERQSQRR